MADAAVAAALRSTAKLVVVEAPGGCGKTFQGAAFAADVSSTLGPGRLLILTHTHAACDVFGDRTKGLSGLEIRTIDSLIGQIAEAYPEPGLIAGALPDYDRNSRWAAGLLKRRPFIADMLARRYPMVVCDEHQDASAEQHAVIESLHDAGARVRAFFDPMQRIYGAGATEAQGQADDSRLAAFRAAADVAESLDVPHRWTGGGEELGGWILESRASLAAGGRLRLTGKLPRGLKVVFADNTAQRNLGFQLDAQDRRPLDPAFNGVQPLLILSHHNDTVQASSPAFTTLKSTQPSMWSVCARANFARTMSGIRVSMPRSSTKLRQSAAFRTGRTRLDCLASAKPAARVLRGR